jgi:hypothetical protein
LTQKEVQSFRSERGFRFPENAKVPSRAKAKMFLARPELALSD